MWHQSLGAMRHQNRTPSFGSGFGLFGTKAYVMGLVWRTASVQTLLRHKERHRHKCLCSDLCLDCRTMQCLQGGIPCSLAQVTERSCACRTWVRARGHILALDSVSIQVPATALQPK